MKLFWVSPHKVEHIYHLVNVAFRRDLHLPILIPRERLPKMKINRTSSLQFEVILLLKSIRE
jgi:hypothetical protein